MKHHSFSPRAAAAAAVAGMAVILAGGTATGAMAAVTSVSASSPRQATPTAPGAPTGLTATPGNGSVTLSWSAPSSDGGSPVDDYLIRGGTSPSDDDILEIVGGHTVTLAVTKGTTYFFSVSAENGSSESPAVSVKFDSPGIGSGTGTGTAPGAPARLKTDYGDGIIVLSWSRPTSAGSSPVTGYHVYMGFSPSFMAAREFTVTGTSFRLNDAQNGSTYFIKVTAINAAGEGPATPATSVIPDPHVTHTPTGLTARAGHGKVTLSWSSPAGGLMDGDGYLIYMSSSPGHEGTTPYVAHLIESATGYTIAPLRDGIRYYFRVALLDHFNGKSAQSAEVSAVPVASPGSGSGSSASTGTQAGNGGGSGGNGGAQNVPGGVTTQPTTPTGPGQAPGQRDTSSGSPGSSAGLIIGLAALSLAGAGGAVAIVLIQRRRQGRGYAQVPTPRRPYDDEPAGPFGRTEEKSGPRYR
jgi:titin